MIVPASITFGQAGKVHYLEQVENWDVFVSCYLGHTVGFNRLMLASVSSLFKRVILDLGESDNVHISTNFSIDELKYLHELCHYGTVEHGPAKEVLYQSLASFGIDLRKLNICDADEDLEGIKTECWETVLLEEDEKDILQDLLVATEEAQYSLPQNC